jgi:hypothetical protein
MSYSASSSSTPKAAENSSKNPSYYIHSLLHLLQNSMSIPGDFQFATLQIIFCIFVHIGIFSEGHVTISSQYDAESQS